MNRGTRRTALAGLLAVTLLVSSCSRDVEGDGGRPDQTAQSGEVDTSQFEGLLTECEIVSKTQLAEALGGSGVRQGFLGAICRWIVSGGVTTDVTLAWYEWGDFNLEKQIAKKHGYETENQQVNSVAAFIARDPARPGVCGVTAKSPGRGTLTWWTEPHGAPPGDPCEGAIKLMELVISRAS
ncbi:MAG: DUF3558 domain-containing protein [Gordonia sp. (in: high G+C Gram-positive bacteria)]|uniref:DUF3558 domain-containing protein n=1 Tax=Gordonia sp. (in: high G+C Gram-positive bacteria) TaxID=84139 RepID=UPI0039E555FC